MRENPVRKLLDLGQSVWMDSIRRKMIATGELRRMVEEEGLSGVTTDSFTTYRAMTQGDEYHEPIHALAQEGRNAEEIYQVLTQEDIRNAADILLPVYEQMDGRGGFAAISISPDLAYDTASTVREARWLWATLDRPNIFIKVPATSAGIPAIQQLVTEGINVHATLLFGLRQYLWTAKAYIAGMEAREAQGKPLTGISGIAGFVLSPIDALVDSIREGRVSQASSRTGSEPLPRERIAIAIAKVAYRKYQEIFRSERFLRLADKGALPLKFLWTSACARKPNCDRLRYVEELIGPDTIQTMDTELLDVYRHRGHPVAHLKENPEEAYRVMEWLARIGIDLDAAAKKLEKEAVQFLIESSNSLMKFLRREYITNYWH